MALSLTLDYALQIVSEPGYYQGIPSEKWERLLNPVGANAPKAFWSDQATRTIMLMPQQLKPGWLNSAEQADSIIGLVERGSGTLVTHPDNTSIFGIFEANLKQNPENPWVFFRPTLGGTLVELLVQIALVALLAKGSFPASDSDARVIAYTQETIVGNQALYFRWLQPDVQAAGLSVMGLCIGQFALMMTDDLVEIHQDISEAQDRTEWERVMSAPLFAPGGTPGGANSAYGNRAAASETEQRERSLLWLPFHRNLVYIEASGGRWCLIQPRQFERLRADGDDWDIVDDAKVLVWSLTPSVGRFQLQKVKWHGSAAQMRLPTFTLDYSPADALTDANFTVLGDEFRGTDIAFTTPTTPPGYDNLANALDSCPAVTTDGTAQTRTYGLTVTLTPSGDDRFTPFLYGAEVRVERAVDTWAIGGITFGDEGKETTKIQHAQIRSDLEQPEQTEVDLDVLDFDPFPLIDRWYRSGYPLQLNDTVGPTVLFTGITKPTVVTPLHYENNRPRHLKINAQSLWQWLDDAPLRDQHDWTGNGHISTVLFIAEQAGIDTSGADLPSPPAAWDFPLGGLETSIPQMGALKPHWKPNAEDSAADFIQRIADQFAGFKVGFYPSGQFYYLPADPYYYTSSEVTFFKSREANPSGPCYEDPVEFEASQPEANVVQVVATAPGGGTIRSALFVDWASILNPDAPNFMGRWRLEIFPIDGVLTCGEVNRIARTLFQQTRRRHLRIRFNADYVKALKVGRVFTLEGQSGTWRLLSFDAEYDVQGIPIMRAEAELVEAGYL